MDIPKPDTYDLTVLDCECGEKYHVINITQSRTLHRPELRRMKDFAKRSGRHFIQSPGGGFDCPKCKARQDLSKPNEKYFASNGKIERIA